MNHLLTIPLFLILAASAAAQPTTTPAIRFPVLVNPTPAPTPAGAVSKLTLERLYVIDCDVPVIVLASPQGLVSITEETGPLRIRGWFVDGLKNETRTYRGKHLFIVEAKATGQVELIVIPVGAAKASDVIRKTLDVDAGEGPRPPPDPPVPPVPPDPKPPDPKPDPVNPPPIPLPGLRVLIVHEEMDRDNITAGHRAIMYGAPMRDFLDAKCVVGKDGKTKEWRIFDKDIDTKRAEKHWADVMQRRPLSLPWLIVSNGKTGFEGPLPASDAEAKKLILKYAE